MPNTAKQEAIRKGYEAIGVDPKESDENGWIYYKWIYHGLGNGKHYHDFGIPEENKDILEIEHHFGSEAFKWRPKSLRRIENNNGWIRIESDEDLPKATSDKFYTYGNNYGTTLENWGNLKLGHRIGRITHYQPIVKPEKPIY